MTHLNVFFANHAGRIGSAFHKPIPMYNVELSVKPKKVPNSVRLLNSNLKVEYNEEENGWINLVVPELGMYDILLIEYSND